MTFEKEVCQLGTESLQEMKKGTGYETTTFLPPDLHPVSYH